MVFEVLIGRAFRPTRALFCSLVLCAVGCGQDSSSNLGLGADSGIEADAGQAADAGVPTDSGFVRPPIEVADIDFGVVTVGETRSRLLRIVNVGDRPTHVILHLGPDAGSNGEIVWERLETDLLVGAELSTELRFEPSELGEAELPLELVAFAYDLKRIVDIRGTSVLTTLTVDAAEVSLGAALGEIVEQTIMVSTLSDLAVDVEATGEDVLPCAESGEVRDFCVAWPEPTGRFSVAPSAPAPVRVRFSPRIAGRTVRGVLRLSDCPRSHCVTEIPLVGRTTQ